jgi:hypothetical protein
MDPDPPASRARHQAATEGLALARESGLPYHVAMAEPFQVSEVQISSIASIVAYATPEGSKVSISYKLQTYIEGEEQIERQIDATHAEMLIRIKRLNVESNR